MSRLTAVAQAGRRCAWGGLVVALTVALLGTVAWRATPHVRTSAYSTPQNGQMESELGVRFTRVDIVGGGGVIELRYVVLDTEKATRFQANADRPPRLQDEGDGDAVLWRTALMKQGHELRPGQEYYILYLNNSGEILPGDTVEIQAGDNRLPHFPVR